MIRRSLLACIVYGVLAWPAQAGTLTRFDLPGQTAICGAAIADDGTVVGNSVGTKPTVNFTYQNGNFILLQPGFDGGLTAVSGINRAHVLVGTHIKFTRNFSLQVKGFALHGSDRRLVHVPGAATTAVTGINNDDTIVGYFSNTVTGPTFGYIKHGESLTTLEDGSGAVVPSGIDPTGKTVVGTSLPAGGPITAWVYSGGTFSQLSPPGAAATFAYGINRTGTISGTYVTGPQNAPVLHGFFYKGGTFDTYDVAGATGTQVTGINAHGAATGCFTDAAGTHGLIYTP